MSDVNSNIYVNSISISYRNVYVKFILAPLRNIPVKVIGRYPDLYKFLCGVGKTLFPGSGETILA